SCLNNETIAAQAQVDSVLLRIQTSSAHSLFQSLEPYLALAAADNLAKSGHLSINGSDSLSAIVQFHVEGFNFLGIPRHNYRCPVNLLCQVLLVLALQVSTPNRLELEPLSRCHCLLELCDCLGVGEANEGLCNYLFELRD